MHTVEIPYLIEFGSIGDSEIGFLSIAESHVNIPFEIKRVFWTYHTPDSVKRGHHAHKKTRQIIMCLKGSIIVQTTQRDGNKQSFTLNYPNIGLYVPPSSWHTMIYIDNAIQLVLASDLYDSSDYIRDFNLFING